jgi:DNA-directed RNA polymerase I, II, and III subunit RPABC1
MSKRDSPAQYWNFRKNILSMMDDRKYNPHPDLHSLDETQFYEQLNKEFENSNNLNAYVLKCLCMLIEKNKNIKHIQGTYIPPYIPSTNTDFTSLQKNNSDDDAYVSKLLILFLNEDSVKVTTVRWLIDFIPYTGIKDILLICNCKGAFNSLAYKEFTEWVNNQQGLRVQIMSTDNVSFNLTNHIFVPEQVNIIPPDELNNWYERHHILPQQMPDLPIHDPLAVWYGLQTGQVVQLIRRSNPHCPYYRKVGNSK